MPKINLLPTRATAKLDAARQELLGFTGALVFTGFALFLYHGVAASRIEDAIAKNEQLKSDVTVLEKKVTEIDGFKAQAVLLEKKLAIIDQLSRSRSGPARVLDGLADVLESQPRVWLLRFESSNTKLVLEGGAIEQEDVSAFQLALAKRPDLFDHLHLNLIHTEHGVDSEFLSWSIQCTPILEAS